MRHFRKPPSPMSLLCLGCKFEDTAVPKLASSRGSKWKAGRLVPHPNDLRIGTRLGALQPLGGVPVTLLLHLAWVALLAPATGILFGKFQAESAIGGHVLAAIHQHCTIEGRKAMCHNNIVSKAKWKRMKDHIKCKAAIFNCFSFAHCPTLRVIMQIQTTTRETKTLQQLKTAIKNPLM